MKRLVLVLVVLFSLVGGVAQAQQRDFSFEIAQKLRAHMDMTFLAVTAGDVDTFSIGINPREANIAGTPTPGIGFGYALREDIYVGGRLKLGYGSMDTNSDMGVFDWQILPYGEYLFLSGPMRPFVAAQLGVGGAKFVSDGGDQHTVQFIISGGGGFHYFLAPAFSIDALALLGGRLGSTNWDAPAGNGPDSADASYFIFEALLGISGWFSAWP